ncbi:unnamed protein product [Closterium sp. Naga37s-1]|nr:unnamed protein product [Closterium sp. Naga37s-1]
MQKHSRVVSPFRMSPVGEPPSPRAAHAATAVGTMIVIQGGIGPAGLATDDLHVLDLTQARPKWHRVVVQGAGPGPRYGHVMALVGQRFLLSISGNDGKRPLADVWTLDTAAKPYEWKKLEPDGEGPPPCMYATASSRHDGLLLLCGGRDGSSVPLPGAYGLARHRDGRWEWAIAPGVSPSARYQHAAVFVNLRLHVSGGALGGGRMVEDASSVAVLDTAAGVWCDRKGTVAVARTGRFSADAPGGDASTELTRRCRHAAAAVANSIFIYGGLRGGILLDDLLIADDSPPEPPPLPAPSAKAEGVGNRRPPVAPRKGARGDAAAAAAAGSGEEGANGLIFKGRGGVPGRGVFGVNSKAPPIGEEGTDGLSFNGRGASQGGALFESTQSGEEGAEGLSFNGRGGVPGRGGAGGSDEEEEEEEEEGDADDSSSNGLHPSTSSLTSHSDDGRSDTPDFKGGVRLHHRAVVVSADPGGNSLGGLVRQLSIEHFENEGRRISYSPDGVQAHRRLLDRQMSIQGVHKKVLQTLLKPRGWKPPVSRQFFLDVHGVVELCDLAETHFKNEPSVLQVRAPVKIFGDLHGQFGDLMRLFDEYGSPSTAGDIAYIDYLFLGDYVDRGQHSLETIILLLALKIEFPRNVHLIRGNHEAADINALFGFRMECIERMGEEGGIWAWHRINQLFNWLPLAALIEHKILCMHGGIGRSIQHVSQIEELKRPITMEAGSMVLMDLLWSDPTENDSIEGLQPNARGPGLVTFGPDRVMEFCHTNDLQLIIRAHECVMDGFERFAGGHLITLFSATNYCGTANNAGAILVLGRDLVVFPKMIHPLPPTGNPANSSDDQDDTTLPNLIPPFVMLNCYVYPMSQTVPARAVYTTSFPSKAVTFLFLLSLPFLPLLPPSSPLFSPLLPPSPPFFPPLLPSSPPLLPSPSPHHPIPPCRLCDATRSSTCNGHPRPQGAARNQATTATPSPLSSPSQPASLCLAHTLSSTLKADRASRP